MKVFIISDNRLIDRQEALIKELVRQGIDDFEIMSCIILPDVVESINASHKLLVSIARDRGLEEVTIMEDDCYFPANDGWNYFLRNKPEQFKIYSACNYLNRDYPIAKETVGLHCYVLHNSAYDDFMMLPNKEHIDTCIKDIPIHICYPYAALQRPGYSSNNRIVVDYNLVLNPEDIYIG